MTRFNISYIIGHNLGKNALRPENNFHQGGGDWRYLVPSHSANKQKGHKYGV